MRKIIKKILNLFGWLSLSMMLLLVVLTIVINSPKVQDYITENVFVKLQNRLGNSISYSKMKLTVFNKVEFSNLLITDQNSDTIVYAPAMRAGFPGLLRKVLFHRELPMEIGSLVFNNSTFNYAIDSNGVSNIQFLIDSLAVPRDSINRPSKPMFINKIKVKNSRFSYNRYGSSKRDFGIDFTKMRFHNLNFNISDLVIHSDTLGFNIKSLSFVEKSGFQVDKMNTRFEYSKKSIHFDELNATTTNSDYSLNKIYFDFDSIKYFGTEKLYTAINLDCSFRESKIYLEELGYFARIFEGMQETVILSGKLNGTLSELNCRQLSIDFGSSTSLKGDFDISGLPDVESTFLIFDIANFTTSTNDILSFKLPRGKNIKLPSRFSAITSWHYSGNFTGFFRDFVSYGTLNTNLGSIKTDVLFEPDSVNRLTFSGRLSCNDYNIGKLIGTSDLIGKVSLDMTVDGLGYLDNSFDVNLDGDISEFEVNGYAYENIKVDGEFAQNKFNGIINVDDKNLKLNFDGLVDLSSEIRQYKFLANVTHANFYMINIEKTDPNYTGSFLVNADISGNKLDEINGNVKLLNSFFSKSDAQIQIYDLNLDLRNDANLNRLKLTSDFADAEVSGHYRLSQLIDEYKILFEHLLPALSDSIPSDNMLSKTELKYIINFKNSTPLFRFFMPDFNVQPKTSVFGEFKRNEGLFSKIHIQSPGVKIKKTNLENLTLNSITSQKGLEIEMGCKSMNLNNRVRFENITIITDIDSNNANYKMRWLNWDSSLYKGTLSGNLAFLNRPGEKPRIFFEVDSSNIVINDSLWALSPFTFLTDSNSATINKFALWHGDEYLTINGKLSDNSPGDSLTCKFKSFDFGNLNFFTRSTAFKFGGILDGDAIIKGFTTPLFFASLFVKDLELNGEIIGDTYIDSRWVDQTKSIKIEANAKRGVLNTLNIDGNYFIAGSKLDFQLNFNKFRLEFVNPYLDNVFDDIRGVATGIVTLKGTALEPMLNGDLNLQKAAFTVDYLKTRYNFTSNLSIANNNLIFDNITMYDIYGNTAIMNGLIRTEYFKKYNLDLTINTNKFFCLNTTEDDNSYFFGTAFATGIIKINGEPSSLKFDVTASTDAGTIFNIPVSETEELSEYTFIKYINDEDNGTTSIKEDYKVNLTGMQLDFNLKVTPEASVKIIFDPTMGDEIEGTGSGDLRLSINTMGDFKMVGDYVIEQGTYLFTLQDVFANWMFNVKQGSTLRWSGDPINADVNINTYLRRKASLADLDPANVGMTSKTTDCVIELTGKLMSPEVKYGIEMPYAEQQTIDLLNSYINSDEEKGKQFIALLILKKFLPADNTTSAETDIAGEAGKANASELLSNQLTNWMSQFSDEFDLGVNYRPGSETSSQEWEVALSTQLFNDKLSINGSVDYKTNAETEQASSIVGDVDIDYKLTKNGKLRTRVYNRANENTVLGDPSSSSSAYTQGAGIFYTEEFDNVSELTKRFRDAIRRKNKKEPDDQTKVESKAEAIKNDEELLD